MTERIVADPVEVATGRTELDISDWIKADGVDWGDGEIAAYMADMGYGSTPVDFRVPNRTITIPLSLQTRGGTSFETVRQSVQAKVARWQQEGGWLKRVTAAGTLYCDVVNASLKLTGSWMQAHRDADVEASMTLEALPDFYGNEIALATHSETSAAELTFTETGILGNYPARVRMAVTNTQAVDQLGLFWGYRSRNYSSASTARLAYEAEALEPLDTAAGTALAGASGGTAVRHSGLQTFWLPMLGTDIGGTAPMTHTGSYQVLARAYTNSGGTVATTQDAMPQLRFAWGVGSAARPSANDPATVPGAGAFYILDLGGVILEPSQVGTHYWTGVVQALGGTAGSDVAVDKLWFVPTDESNGQLRALPSSLSGQVSLLARDDFTSLGNGTNLNTRTAPVGGTWATAAAGAGGSSTDFQGDGAGNARRTTTSDQTSGKLYGRRALFSPTYGEVEVGGDFNFSAYPTADGQFYPAALARYVDTSNFAAFGYIKYLGLHLVVLNVVVGGNLTNLGSKQIPALANTWLTLRLTAKATGQITGQVFVRGNNTPLYTLSGGHSALATGGTLASGQAGIQDYNGSATAITRLYDNVYAVGQVSGTAVPTDVVAAASRSVELRTDGVFREEAAGGAWVRTQNETIGDLPRLPVSGAEGRTVEAIMKLSRGNLSELPDLAIDDVSGRLYYRPCWLNTPG